LKVTSLTLMLKSWSRYIYMMLSFRMAFKLDNADAVLEAIDP